MAADRRYPRITIEYDDGNLPQVLNAPETSTIVAALMAVVALQGTPLMADNPRTLGLVGRARALLRCLGVKMEEAPDPRKEPPAHA